MARLWGMNQRQLDLALLVGIGALLVVILILALSSAPLSAAGDIDDPVERVAAARTAEATASAPAAAASSAESAAELSPATPTTVGAAAAAVAAGESPEEAQPAAGGEATVGAAPPSEDAAAGAVTLGRVGFAYTTGDEGACGVPLQAWQHLALSRDLLARYPCGTVVTLTLEDAVAGRSMVRAQVGDTMGADISGTVNIFVGEDEPALEYGVTRGALAP